MFIKSAHGIADYLSLDIEGLEALVLATLPFNMIDIRVMTIECMPESDKGKAILEILTNVGYKYETQIEMDMVFVKQ